MSCGEWPQACVRVSGLGVRRGLHAQAQVTIDVEDLEADASPEDLMLSYVSGEKGKVRLTSYVYSPEAARRQLCFASWRGKRLLYHCDSYDKLTVYPCFW